jgi:hypothetical protein
MPKFLRPLILALVAAFAACAFGVGTAQAAQKSSCSKALIRDWFVDGRIDKTYQVHCYREALKDVPEDQIVYGTLRDDLRRALEQVIGDHNGNVGPNTLVLGADQTGPNDPGDGTGATGSGKHDKGFFHWVARKFGPSTADSVPVPLLILGGLALALVAAAAVSFFARRYQARKAAPDPPPSGP